MHLHILGDESEEIYNTFTWQPQEEKTLCNVLKKFDYYFIPRINVIYETHIFVTCSQTPGESIIPFVSELKREQISVNMKHSKMC